MKFKFLFTPALALGILLVLLISTFKLGISRLAVVTTSVKKAQEKENILKQKQDILMGLDPELSSQVNLVAATLPDANSSLPALYQIKRLALEKAVVFSNFKIGTEIKEKSDLARADITFEVEGEIQGLISFLNSLKTVAPVLTVDRAELSLVGSGATATVRISSYWSPFPTKLSFLEEPIKEITNEEREILAQVLRLTPPPFVQLSASPPIETADPFR